MDRIKQDMGRHSLEDMAASRPRGLAVLRRLLDLLDREGIRYCHWKSNEHLFEGMVGLTDLDVLFERAGTPALDRVFSEAGFKRFLTTPMRWHPGLEDYVGFDEETGNLIHVHAHHLLRMGEKNAKGYWLPWEELFLSSRQVQQPEGMYASHPDLEMIIFFLRAALKTRLRDRALALFGVDYMKGDLEREFIWLRQRCQPARVEQLVRELLGPRPAAVAAEMLVVSPSLDSLVRFRRASNDMLKRCRTHGPIAARLRRWIREAFGLRAAVARRYTHPPKPMNRTVPCGGLIIAFVGSDGSGKSTVVNEITHWLSWKVDVLKVYHGSGDGPSSLLRWPLRQVHRILSGGAGAPRGADGPGGGSGARSSARRAARKLRWVWALVLSFEKRHKLKKCWRARNRGMVVICDRYPQNQVSGYNDGPLLAHWRESPSRLLRALSRWEGDPYVWAERLPPDLLFRMHVSPEVALARKPDMTPGEVARRVDTVRRLSYPGSRILDVDADAPLDKVILRIKQDLWAAL